jgi:hypothetical protein
MIRISTETPDGVAIAALGEASDLHVVTDLPTKSYPKPAAVPMVRQFI